MINKDMIPKECCDCQSYKCQVPMPLNGRLQSIDYCIADIVASLNASNIRTLGSCCGHGGKVPTDITLEDGRRLTISFPDDWKAIGGVDND